MVVGLDRFRQHFAGMDQQYVLIGGTAADLLMESVGLEFRATKDLDIVLMVDDLSEEFARRFWDFIREGDYQLRQHSSGAPVCYRFQKPGVAGFPVMIELFSSRPAGIELPRDAGLTPIPVGEEASSLSAILMNQEYHELVKNHRIQLQDLPVLNTPAMIVLKAVAFSDLYQRKANGVSVDSRDVRKHKNDVYRLANILDTTQSCSLTDSIRKGLKTAFDLLSKEPVDLRALAIPGTTQDELLCILTGYYGVKG